MASASMELQHRAIMTREAHVAVRDRKSPVDLATEKIHAAELEAAGLAIGRVPEDISQQEFGGRRRNSRLTKPSCSVQIMQRNPCVVSWRE